MESATPAAEFGRPTTGDKGLKRNAVSFVSSVVIGVASTAPGYSLAAVLGFVARPSQESPDSELAGSASSTGTHR